MPQWLAQSDSAGYPRQLGQHCILCPFWSELPASEHKAYKKLKCTFV